MGIIPILSMSYITTRIVKRQTNVAKIPRVPIENQIITLIVIKIAIKFSPCMKTQNRQETFLESFSVLQFGPCMIVRSTLNILFYVYRNQSVKIKKVVYISQHSFAGEQFLKDIFSGTIFPGIFFPGDHFSGTFFSRTYLYFDIISQTVSLKLFLHTDLVTTRHWFFFSVVIKYSGCSQISGKKKMSNANVRQPY